MASETDQPTILVAEDDRLIAELVEFKLSRHGHRVVVVADGEEAFAAAADLRPDLIVLDGMLPGLDGFDVLRRLKQDDILKNIPVVMLSARGLEKDVIMGLRLGANDYVVKPFKPDELMVRIERLLPKRGT